MDLYKSPDILKRILKATLIEQYLLLQKQAREYETEVREQRGRAVRAEKEVEQLKMQAQQFDATKAAVLAGIDALIYSTTDVAAEISETKALEASLNNSDIYLSEMERVDRTKHLKELYAAIAKDPEASMLNWIYKTLTQEVADNGRPL